MQNVPSTIVAGLYLTQLMLQIQLNEASSEMSSAEWEEFTRTMSTGELSESGQKAFDKALSKSNQLLIEQFGVLQATQLTRGLFQPAILRVIIEHLMLHAESVDWGEVSQEIPHAAERFKVEHLINKGLSRPLGPRPTQHIREQFEQFIRMLNFAWPDAFFPSDSDYRYMQLWSKFLPDARSLCESLYQIGLRPVDEEGSPTAVANLLGTESGEFEAFCILYSLGPELAAEWEKDQVSYGFDAYDGAVARAKQYANSNERDSIFAGALAAGYPVRDLTIETDEFSDLIIQIPGFVHDSEQWLVNNLIQSIAPLLYQSLADDRYHKSQKWRGLRLSPDFTQTQYMIEDSIGASGWMPAVRLRVQAFVNQSNRTSKATEEPDDYTPLARKHRTPRASSLRVTYLIDQLCDIIEHDFYGHDFLK
ncbi:hypothetical protein [Pseudomonas sp. X4]|uniref:hypothetical protein n=1 Tax=Pseudomonas sp. X4 TaxID=3231526 RepID=UPI0034607219